MGQKNEFSFVTNLSQKFFSTAEFKYVKEVWKNLLQAKHELLFLHRWGDLESRHLLNERKHPKQTVELALKNELIFLIKITWFES